jgi:hypothetical protein
MEKPFGKPLTLKGLENLSDPSYSIWREAQIENGKLTSEINFKYNDSAVQSNRGKRGGIKGGKTQGDLNSINGHLEKTRKMAIEARQLRAEEGYQKTLDQLPNEFTGIDVQKITVLPYPTIKYGVLNGKIIKVKRNLYRKLTL